MDELQILYEDEAFLVINKPSGMTVNKAETTRHEFTVQDWMERRYGIVERITEGEAQPAVAEGFGEAKWDPEVEFYKRGGVVHRLDKETSGILLLAKTPAAFAALQKQFKDRTVHKTYIALCHGSVIPSEGEISVPVGRLPWNRKQFGIVPGGRPSVTKYIVISNFKFLMSNDTEMFSLVELYPETGRTHQIRVHMKYIGFPLFGDFLYAGRKTSRDDRKLLERVFLHAAKISFRHPSTDTEMHFEAPLPAELQKVLDGMEKIENN
jgi:23S rRNA pseudouridine1911/1915/1917 synthase